MPFILGKWIHIIDVLYVDMTQIHQKILFAKIEILEYKYVNIKMWIS